jgi:hypothetical protein
MSTRAGAGAATGRLAGGDAALVAGGGAVPAGGCPRPWAGICAGVCVGGDAGGWDGGAAAVVVEPGVEAAVDPDPGGWLPAGVVPLGGCAAPGVAF